MPAGAWLLAALEPVPGGPWIIALTLVGSIALGAPLFVAIGLFATACFFAWPEFESITNNYSFIAPMEKLAEEPTMVAIPFFMMAGAIMSRGQIAARLIEVAKALTGGLPGGLALSAVLACAAFAAISGSSPVTVVTIGAIMVPALEKAGYGEKRSVGLLTSAGTLGIIIPPSIPMIVYAIFATSAGQPVDVDDLFIAGASVGVLLWLMLSAYCVLMGRNVPGEPTSLRRLGAALLDGTWALFLPLFIIGGIYSGLFNATEASAISVALAIVVEVHIHRSMRYADIPAVLVETAVLMGSILIIICVAFGFTEFMTFRQIPDAIVEWLRGFEMSSWTFILIINLLLLVVGCLMDIISAIILFVPLVVPIAAALEIDPVHLGLVFIVNLEIGYLTPPIGLNLFVASTYFRKPLGLVLRSVLPYLAILMVALALVSYLPFFSKVFLNLRDDQPIWQSFPETRLAPRPPEPEGEEGAPEPSLFDQLDKPPVTAPPGPPPAAEAEPKAGEPPGEEDFPPADEPEGDEPKSIQDLMNDPAYLERLKEELDKK